MKNNRKGFTLIELLVVVLILGILAAMAMPQYFKAVERSRMSEAVSLLGSIASAQQRKYLQINQYSAKYKGLDVAPQGEFNADDNTFYTKGSTGNGFEIKLAGTGYTAGQATATRVANGSATGGEGGELNYQYSLSRYYASNDTTCTGKNSNGQALCADFCGIDTPVASCCSDGGKTACTTPSTGNTTGGGTGGGN